MKKSIIPLLLTFAFLNIKGQGNDGKTKVDLTGAKSFTITNLQTTDTRYVIRLPNFMWDTTDIVLPGQSLLYNTEYCGGFQIYRYWSTRSETGIELTNCIVLEDRTVQMVSKLRGDIIEVQVKFTVPPSMKYYYFSIPMTDGSIRKVKAELNNKVGDWYKFTIKL